MAPSAAAHPGSRTFDPSASDAHAGFDFRALVDDFRCRPTEWVAAHRDEMVRAQRRARIRELAALAVLDERRALDDTLAARDGVSVRTARETVETARALVDLPAVAAAAHAGALSDEQLGAVTRLADASSDAEWAVRAPNFAAADLARLARTREKPTAADADRRRDARSLGWWWRRDAGMLSIRGELADIDGALVESVLSQMIDRMRPAKGQTWDSRAHRGADALVELARNYADVEAVGSPRTHLVVEVPLHGPAEICGIPLPDSMVERLRSGASIEPVLVDDAGLTLKSGRTEPVLPPKRVKAVLRRDGHCRWPGCTRRTGLHVHHLWPASWGRDDRVSNLAAVCTMHHPQLVPHGAWLLVGNPNWPDGLRVLHRREIGDHTRFTGLEDVLCYVADPARHSTRRSTRAGSDPP